MAKPYTNRERKRIKRGIESGETCASIALALPGRSPGAIAGYAYRNGWKAGFNDASIKIERWERARGTSLLAHCQWAAGRFSKRDVAKEAGISVKTLRRYVVSRDPALWSSWSRVTERFLRAMRESRKH